MFEKEKFDRRNGTSADLKQNSKSGSSRRRRKTQEEEERRKKNELKDPINLE